jgi:hypothetical protein
MRERYLDLQTGINLSIKEILEFENQKDVVWQAADVMRSLLEDLAETREELVQELQHEAEFIRDSLKKYDASMTPLKRCSPTPLANNSCAKGSELPTFHRR